jgi:ABC-type transport system involved in multi-copper enzyme maturation permease subunit
MNRQSTNLRLIAAKTLKAIFRRKLPYLVLILAVLVLLIVVSSHAFLRMARDAGEIEAAQALQVQSIESVFGIWFLAALVVGIGLGAGTIASEVRSGTIVPVLSKPVNRWAFLAGRWLGNQVFLVGFMGLGFLIGTSVAAAFGLDTNGLYWTALALSLVSILLSNTLATLLGTFLPPALAGGLTFFLIIVQSFAMTLLTQPSALVRYPALFVYYLLPSSPREDVLGQALKSTVLTPDYAPHLMVMLENLGYLASLVLIASAIFTRSEVRSR